MLAPQREVLYGGSAGGGKSEAGLHGAAQYADEPKYSGIIFRRTFADLSLPGALIDRSKEWWSNTDAVYNERDHKWTFGSGATLSFGYLETENHKFRYQSAEFQYIFFDELTQFTETQYTYLLSRLRRTEDMKHIPLRMRGGANPGGVGHDWVKKRFIDSTDPERIFIPSSLDDNPYLDRDEYRLALEGLDHITRSQLLDGNWDVDEEGPLFQRSFFRIRQKPRHFEWLVRSWDLAATDESEGKDPDYTVGALIGYADQTYYVLDIVRERLSSGKVEKLIADTAKKDGPDVIIFMEQEPGASGKANTRRYATEILPEYEFYGKRLTGNKGTRAKPISAQLENGHMFLGFNVRDETPEWVEPLIKEHVAFDPDNTKGRHDDQVDAVSGGYWFLSRLIKAKRRRKGIQHG